MKIAEQINQVHVSRRVGVYVCVSVYLFVCVCMRVTVRDFTGFTRRRARRLC